MKTYTVTAEQDGKFWFVRIPELDGATQGRTLSEVPEMARDYIATVTGKPESSFDIVLQLKLPEAVREHLRKSRELRAEEARLRAQAAEEAKAAALGLRDEGYTMRDIGVALDVSYQRAHQLVSTRS